ncbi:MAG: NlpC/P60 family protein [Desulfitobacteriaceae bacterium]|nr:NlpC/P60 family protein [Desulfitobacteriaceae bacterium]MDD4752401.1 NlpC/P60 family protein [Desulfitobacteriaceae bacterium]
MRKLFIIVTTACVFCFPFYSYAATTPEKEIANNNYIVKSGDTLSAIANAKQVSIQSIVSLNQLLNPNSLSIGQKLIIPGAVSNTEVAGEVPAVTKAPPEKYIVKSGDTITNIARSTGITANLIIAANKLADPNKLSIGQVLVLPERNNTAVSRSDQRQHETNSQDQVTTLIECAKTLLGTPYSYGSSGPNYFDCSGFTMTVFSQIGIELPHSSSLQSKKGEPVEKNRLIPGDLVFFNTSGKGVSHVGIYIGDNSFIHASSTQKKVVITPMADNYFAKRYVTARRVL